MNIDMDIINSFNNKVNEYNFVFFKYRDVEGKMNWNCISSSIQWIRLAINAINETNFDIKSIDTKCMELYKYISCIDIIVESLQQLHRIFFKDNGLTTFPNTNNVFKSKIVDMNDNEYFKTIRASFGAHPVNLTEPKDPHNKELKRFASNPIDNHIGIGNDDRDFSVKLYTNSVDGEDLDFPIWISELQEYSILKYTYLNDLCKKVEELYTDFLNECRSKKINTSANKIEQVSILLAESKSRLDNEYYRTSLEFIRSSFLLTCKNKKNSIVLKLYNDNLLKVVEEIKDKLQNMIFTDLETDKYLDPCLDNYQLPDSFHYALDKLCNAYYGDSKLFYQEPIEEFLSGIIEFNDCDLTERYILTHAGIFYIVNKYEKKPLNILTLLI